MIRNEYVRVFTGVTEIKVEKINLTLGVGKGYNTCNFTGSNIEIYKNEKIKVIMNDDVYYFKVANVDTSEFGHISVIANGFTYDLLNQPTSSEVLSYQNSDELIEGESGTITVINNIPNIDFKGKSYSKTSTPMGRISDMVAVVGGEKYEYNSNLVLEELKSISEAPTIAHSFLDSEVTSFAYSDSSKEKALIQDILINPNPQDIYSKPSIEVDFYETRGKGNVYFNPSLSQGNEVHPAGINLKNNSVIYIGEEILLNDTYFIKTKAGIDSIESIKVDESLFSDYEFVSGHNIIKFNSKMIGVLKIRYKTIGRKFTISKKSSFNIIYLNQVANGVLKPNGKMSNGNFVSIETPLFYNAEKALIRYGYYADLTLIFKDGTGDTSTVHSKNSDLTVKYVSSGAWGDTALLDGIALRKSNAISKIITDNVIFDEDLQNYIVQINDYITNVSEVTLSDGTNIDDNGFTNNIDGSYIKFGSEYESKTVNIAYKCKVSEAEIPIPSNKTVTYLFCLSQVQDNIANTTGKYRNSADGSGGGGGGGGGTDGTDGSDGTDGTDGTDGSDGSDGSDGGGGGTDGVQYCAIPSDMELNVVSLLSTSADKCIGKTIHGDNGLGSFTVNNFGKIKVTVAERNQFVLDCTSIIKDAKIFIDSSKVE